MNCEICCTAALADTVTEALPGVPRLVVTRMTVEVGNDTSFQALNDDGDYDERFACLIPCRAFYRQTFGKHINGYQTHQCQNT